MFKPDKAFREFVSFRDYHWPRFLFNLNPKNLWYDSTNPYDIERHRTAREDITHAYTNLFVEGWRAAAYFMGHIISWAIPFGILLWSMRFWP